MFRKVDNVEKIVKLLPKGTVQQLTGTLRGLERWKVEPKSGTVYLVCTSAGEVGVNLSADHMVCDLSTFESMAQRFGRVNRFGERDDTQIHIVHPKEFDETDQLDQRRSRTLKLLVDLHGDGSPKALGDLDPDARLAAFGPKPKTLPATDILFDSWTLTTIRGRLPGRPPVEPYLHGISEWQPPETYIAWREEVGIITGDLLEQYTPENLMELLEDYPLKPHELLRDNSSRVFDGLKKLKANPETPVWLVANDDSVRVTSLKAIVDAGRDELNSMTVVLPPSAGGLEKGLLTATSTSANDVADEWYDETRRRRRIRVWDDGNVPDGMRRIRTITLSTGSDEDEEMEPRQWFWFERLASLLDSVGSQANRIEPMFAKPQFAHLVPQVIVKAGEKSISILEAGHRAGDALVRCTELQRVLRSAFEDVLKGNAEPMAKIAPTSLVFGVSVSASDEPEYLASISCPRSVSVCHSWPNRNWRRTLSGIWIDGEHC